VFQLKPVVWLGSSLKAVQEFPSVSKRQIGLQLALVQSGEMPSDWKPLRGIGSGVYEIRVHGSGEYRVVYVAKFAQAIVCFMRLVKSLERRRQLMFEQCNCDTRNYSPVWA